MARSRVGNGKVLLSGVNPHSVAYREFADVVCDLVEHMGSMPTVVQQAIIEEAAGLVIYCRTQRASLLRKDSDFNVQSYTTATNSLRRLLADIGQEMRLKDITPSVAEFARELEARVAADGSGDDGDD
jgi:hypothetical protein